MQTGLGKLRNICVSSHAAGSLFGNGTELVLRVTLPDTCPQCAREKGPHRAAPAGLLSPRMAGKLNLGIFM